MNVYVSNYMFIYTQFTNKPESIVYLKSDARPEFASEPELFAYSK